MSNQTVTKQAISYSERADIIQATYAEYNENRETLSRMCSAKTYINGDLIQRGMRALIA